MSEDYRELKRIIERMSRRKEAVLKIMADLQKVVAEVDADIHAAQLQLDAHRLTGDSEFLGDK